MSKVDRLENRIGGRRKKRDRARKGRARQLKLFKKTKKTGHKKQAAKWGREAVRHDKAIEKLEKAINKQKAKRGPKSGTGVWGGSKSIIVNESDPVAKKQGIPKTSSKRGISHWATLLNPDSDHSVLALSAFARDYGTTDGSGLARSIANSLGISNYSTGNYNSYYIKRNVWTYRVQILWAVSGHFDHVHVGIRRV